MKRASLKERKKRISLRRKIFGGLFFSLLAALIYFFVFSNIFWIKEIEVTDNGLYFSSSQVKEIAEKRINEKFWHFIPRKSIVLIPSQAIRKDVLEKYPEIKEVRIMRKLPHSLKIEIKERESIGLWCQAEEISIESEKTEEIKKEIIENCSYIDNQGIIFRNSPSMTGSLILKIFDYQKKEAKIREQVIAPEIIDFIIKIKKELSDSLNIKILRFETISPEELRVVTNQGWQIYFNPSYSTEKQIINLKAVLEEEIKDRTIEYIDLRIKDRIYYK